MALQHTSNPFQAGTPKRTMCCKTTGRISAWKGQWGTRWASKGLRMPQKGLLGYLEMDGWTNVFSSYLGHSPVFLQPSFLPLFLPCILPSFPPSLLPSFLPVFFLYFLLCYFHSVFLSFFLSFSLSFSTLPSAESSTRFPFLFTIRFLSSFTSFSFLQFFTP